MFRRNHIEHEYQEIQRSGQAMLATHTEMPLPDDTAGAPAVPDSSPAPDFLPPDFRAPTRQDCAGFMMRWDQPIVVDGEVRACPECGAYRSWAVFSMRDDTIWLRCTAGHETKEPGLDTAWFNRHSGPIDTFHPTLDEALHHLGL
ncbi:hypothetical protein [Actinacidiphila sp. bgisy144]|uniref:hypothetical protein n=1 Tax=Actinacidiphila sp. bgisy144 TaxID=3413791 RepID=UPI003EB6A385